MKITVGLENLIDLSGGIENLISDIGKNYEDASYSGDISVYDDSSRVSLIEIHIEYGFSKFTYKEKEYEIDLSDFNDLFRMINYFSEKNVKFRALDDTIYGEFTSVDDMRFCVAIHNRIDFYFDISTERKSTYLSRVNFREIFVSK